MTPTMFSQRDPQWAADQLGTGTLTIGRAGCLLTCVASVLADCGVGTDPGRLNAWLTTNRGYLNDDLFIFAAIEPLGVKLTRWDCYDRPAPVAKLRENLLAGRHAVCMVDFSPGGTVQPHWVRVLEAHDWRIMDPWRLPGNEARDLGDYYAVGWDAARAILAVATYEPNVALRSVRHAGFAGPAQDFVCIAP